MHTLSRCGPALPTNRESTVSLFFQRSKKTAWDTYKKNTAPPMFGRRNAATAPSPTGSNLPDPAAYTSSRAKKSADPTGLVRMLIDDALNIPHLYFYEGEFVWNLLSKKGPRGLVEPVAFEEVRDLQKKLIGDTRRKPTTRWCAGIVLVPMDHHRNHCVCVAWDRKKPQELFVWDSVKDERTVREGVTDPFKKLGISVTLRMSGLQRRDGDCIMHAMQTALHVLVALKESVDDQPTLQQKLLVVQTPMDPVFRGFVLAHCNEYRIYAQTNGMDKLMARVTSPKTTRIGDDVWFLDWEKHGDVSPNQRLVWTFGKIMASETLACVLGSWNFVTVEYQVGGGRGKLHRVLLPMSMVVVVTP